MPADGLETSGPVRECVLGVERSLKDRRWVSRVGDDRAALALAQHLQMPEIVGRILAARGVGVDDARSFLNPTLRDLLPDPSHLRDMDVGVERLVRAVTDGERIAVFGDYDVDGAASAALLTRVLVAVGSGARIYIPDRVAEGYGPNAEALLALRREGITLAVTVDCGATAHEPLAAAREADLDVIVVDHHEGEARLPPAVAVINPNRLDEDSPHRHLAAVGVTFLLAVGLNRGLREAGWYGHRQEPDLRRWLDLVALGTVCDVVPLTGVNRALVTSGLKVMAARGNPGLRVLGDLAGLGEAPTPYHLGFVLGPRINAGGRVGRADLGARLLTTEDSHEAQAIAVELDELNRQRQATEAAVLQEALAQMEATEQDRESASLIFVSGAGWHPGVLGIVASRLSDRFRRPALVASINGGIATGSGRSVAGVDLGAPVIAARQAGHASKGGGHAMAAGFTAEVDRLEDLRRFLDARLGQAIGTASTQRDLGLDGALRPSGASTELLEVLERLGPFGSGNPEPRFAVPAARLAFADVVGDNHVRCAIAGDGGGRLKAIAFRSLDSEFGQALLNHDGAPLHLAGRLRRDTWQGANRVELLLDDAAPAW